ncbi:MAG: fibronectin type III domain-containing protein, partial [Actinobacteria bacterium]|nr:fibronectin type III domain-containing protein [Actinomycetota bacterium]
NNLYGTFSRVDNGCWGLAGQSVEAHELMHNLGGVQESAPNATIYNHCTDERDRMCYADGSGQLLIQMCATSHENVFDCNHDDYFHTSPPAGSYLAGHWNTANSRWLIPVPATTPPGAPSGVTAVPGEGLATLTWSPPASNGGSPISGYVVTPYVGTTARTAQTFPSTATTQTVTGLANGTAYGFKVAAVNSAGTGPQSETSLEVVPSVGSRFTPLPPARVLDTRTGTGAPAAAVSGGAAIDLQVTGRGGVPASDVSAVVLNVTVTEPATAGHLTVWPAGETRPVASNLNFVPGRTVPNLVVVKVGSGGRVSLYNGGAGGAHVVADMAGWYGPSGATAGSRYHPLAPARLLDTRLGLGAVPGKVASGGTLDLGVAGQGGVPATGVSAVVLNVTVHDPLAGGYLTAWPTG